MPGRVLSRQPGPDDRDVDAGNLLDAAPVDVREQRTRIARVGADGVRRQAPAGGQMPLERP